MKLSSSLAAERIVWGLATVCCLFVIGADHSCCAEDQVTDNKEAVSVVFRDTNIYDAVFIDNGRHLVFGSSAGIHSRSVRGEGHLVQYSTNLAFHVSGAEKGTVISARPGQSFFVWRVGDRAPIYSRDGYSPQVSPSGRFVAVGTNDGCLLFDTEKRSTKLIPANFDFAYPGLTAFPAGDGIVSYSQCRRGVLTVRLFETTHGRMLNQLNALHVRGLVNQVRTFRPALPRTNPPSQNGLAVHVDGSPSHRESNLLLWNTDKNWRIARISHPGINRSVWGGVAMSTDRAYTLTPEGQIAKWRLSDGMLLGFLHADGNIRDAACSSDGKFLALGVVVERGQSWRDRVVIRNLEEKTEAKVTTRNIKLLRFSPSADRLVIVDHDRELKRDEAKIVDLKRLQWRPQIPND